MRGFVRSAAPDEGGVAGDQAGGDGERVDGLKTADDGEAGFVDVASLNCLICKGFRAGDRTVEVVGVGSAEGGDGHRSLGEAGGEFGVGVDYGADRWELAVEQSVGVEVRGRLEGAFDDVAVEVRNYHAFNAEVVVIDAGGLDDDEALLAIDAADVAEGIEDEAATNQFEVGFEDGGAEGFEEHGISISRPADHDLAAI